MVLAELTYLELLNLVELIRGRRRLSIWESFERRLLGNQIIDISIGAKTIGATLVSSY